MAVLLLGDRCSCSSPKNSGSDSSAATSCSNYSSIKAAAGSTAAVVANAAVAEGPAAGPHAQEQMSGDVNDAGET
jgi:hypothetical protein